MNWTKHIRADPDIAGGKPVIAGTRLTVDFLLGLLAEGWTLEQLYENYPGLTEDSVRAVFGYAAETLGDETMYPTPKAG